MLFNSLQFALFFPVVFGLYWMVRRHLRLQNFLLLVASYVFYGAWDPRFLFLIVISTAVDYSAALMIHRGSMTVGQRLRVSAGLILAALAFVVVRHDTLDGVTRVIDPGISALGIPLNECTREFRDQFESADLVLGKGQAHYETLADGEITSYFLMRVKCQVMAKHQGVSVADIVLVKS